MGRLRAYFRPQGDCMVFLGRSPVVWFSPPKAAFILAPQRAPTFPAERCFITPEGESPQPACKAKPITGRTLGAQGRQARRRHQPSPAGRQPSGIQVSADSSQRPITSNDTHSKKALTITVSASFLISSFLSSRAASSQVLSAFVSLTTVFGMGTGVSSQLSPLNL